MLVRFFILTLAISCACGGDLNNVCPTFRDYATIRYNSRCWYNPDVDASPGAITKRYGYRLENHKIVTPDGYILTLNRMVPLGGTPGKVPVLMQHGICNNAGFWLLHGNTSTPLYLADMGYDVWLSNVRGTEVSMRHMRMSPTDPTFWDFSFHEMAMFDTPSILEYIKKKTGGKKTIFIGHSMGGTIQFIYASMLPKHAKEHINGLISIAPVVYTKHMKTEVAKLLSPYSNLILEEMKNINFLGSGVYPHLGRILDRICSTYPYIYTCQQLVEAFSGASDDNSEPEVMPLFFKRYPASFSMKSLAHFGQEFASGGKFQMFDYGTDENMIRYKSRTPLEYDVRKINVPVYIIYGGADLLSVEEDNKELFANLKTEDKHLVRLRGANDTVEFAHQDFLFSKSLMLMNQYISEILRNITVKENNQRETIKKR